MSLKRDARPSLGSLPDPFLGLVLGLVEARTLLRIPAVSCRLRRVLREHARVSLDLRGRRGHVCALADADVPALARSFRAITALSLPPCARLTNEGLKGLGCPEMRRLRVEASPACEGALSGRGVAAVLSQARHLDALELVGCYGALDAIAWPVSLTHLALCGGSFSGGVVQPAALAAAARGCQLRCLNLSQASGVNRGNLLGLLGEALASSPLLALTELDLSHTGIEPDMFAALCRSGGLRLLTTLNLYECEELGDEALFDISRRCPALTDLDISSCCVTDAGVASLQRCCQLEALDINYCTRVGDGGIIPLVQACPNLSRLILSGPRDAMTDAALEAISRHCPSMARVDLYCCRGVTDSGLAVLATGCPGITHLNLHGCTGITVGGLQPVSRCCRRLSALNLTSVFTSNEAAALVGELFPTLPCLNLCYWGYRSEGGRLSDEGVAALPAGLTDLDLSFCTDLTDEGLSALCARTPGLRRLKLAGCSLTTLSRDMLAETLPECAVSAASWRTIPDPASVAARHATAAAAEAARMAKLREDLTSEEDALLPPLFD